MNSLNSLRDKVGLSRKLIQKGHKDQLREIRIEGKRIDKQKLPKELGRYKKAEIFQAEAGKLKPGKTIGPVMVGLETKLLTEDEIAVLCRGPKFCVRRILSEERFMVECEKCYFKIRVEMRDEDEQEDPGGGQEETAQERSERIRIEKEIELAEITAKTVFNEDEMTIDYSRKRATDCKHNTCVKLPGPKNIKVEEGIELRRLTWRKIFRDYMKEFTDERGVQESNLTEGESRGLKSLQKRVKEGELVVVRTDKSGKFSLMSLEEYRRAGEVHTSKDKEVTVEFLLKNQRKINGHLSMLLKTFMVGRSHDHYERIRNLKITHSMSVAPLYLLFKDHKGWTLETGKPPPSRPVVSAGAGQNDHLSEIVSHILEPIVKMRPGGMEVTSTGDFIARVEGINKLSLPLEEIDLEEVDKELDNQARLAQERYDRWDQDRLQGDAVDQEFPSTGGPSHLNGVGAPLDQTNSRARSQPPTPPTSKNENPSETLQSPILTSGPPKMKNTAKQDLEAQQDILEQRWKEGPYNLIVQKTKLMADWSDEAIEVKEAILDWLTENEVSTLVEEGEDILDGLESLNSRGMDGVTDDVLLDVGEIVTAIIVAEDMDKPRVAKIFQKVGEKDIKKVKKTGRAEGMKKMREELRKLKNQRLAPTRRHLGDSDFEELEIKEIRRGDTARRMETGTLRSETVDNKLLQDKGTRIKVVGADVEALYPSLDAMEVAEIVYRAMLDTKVKLDNVDWAEAAKYIALTSTEQEVRLSPLRRVIPVRRKVNGTRPGITGEGLW